MFHDKIMIFLACPVFFATVFIAKGDVTCESSTDSVGVVDCFSNGKFSSFQWAVCGKSDLCSKGSKGKCWMPCMFLRNGATEGPVKEECLCDPSKELEIKVSLDYSVLSVEENGCDWYEELSKITTGLSPSTFVNMKNLCLATRSAKHTQVKTWLSALHGCLRNRMSSFVFYKQSQYIQANFQKLFETYANSCYERSYPLHCQISPWGNIISYIGGLLKNVKMNDLFDLKSEPECTKTEFHLLFSMGCKGSYKDFTDDVIAHSLMNHLGLTSEQVEMSTKRFPQIDAKATVCPLVLTMTAVKPKWYLFFHDHVDVNEVVENLKNDVKNNKLGEIVATNAQEKSAILMVTECVDQNCHMAGRSFHSDSTEKCTALGGKCISTTSECCPGLFFSEGNYCSEKDKGCCFDNTQETENIPVCSLIGGTCVASKDKCSAGSIVDGTCAELQFCCLYARADPQYNLFGNISAITPKGRKSGGSQSVENSKTEVKYALSCYNGLKSNQQCYKDSGLKPLYACFVETGKENCLHPALIAGIASRETNFGTTVRNNDGWGDYRNGIYNGYGVLQCDVITGPVKDASNGQYNCTSFSWDSCEHLKMMIRFGLVIKIKEIQKKHPNWTKEKQLQGGVAAYNCGSGRVTDVDDIDKRTTNKDYSNDVLARAQYLITDGDWR